MRNSAGDNSLKLTDEEIKLGWTMETLTAYQHQRDSAVGHLVAGNVVTPLVRSKPPLIIESCKDFNPHNWRKHG